MVNSIFILFSINTVLFEVPYPLFLLIFPLLFSSECVFVTVLPSLLVPRLILFLSYSRLDRNMPLFFTHVIRSKYHFSIFFGSNGVTFNTPLTRKRPLPEHFVHTSRSGSRVSKSFTIKNPFPLQWSHNFITSIFNMPSIVFISKIIIIFSTSGLSRFCRDPNITSCCGTNNIQLLIFNKNKS